MKQDALLCSLFVGQESIAKLLLLESGVSIDVKDRYHRTPLHYATSGDIVKLIVGKIVSVRNDYNISEALKAVDTEGYTPLHTGICVRIYIYIYMYNSAPCLLY
jgi:hypothetical protein